MKSKCVFSADAPFSLAKSFNWKFRSWLFNNVAIPLFHVDAKDLVNWGPAACYQQLNDYCDTQGGPAISYNLSGVTLKADRDFEAAGRLIHSEIEKRVRKYWRGEKVHVMIVIHTSNEEGTKSLLIEPPPFYIDTTIDTTDLKKTLMDLLWKKVRIFWRGLCKA